MEEEIDFAQASGQAMAAILLANNVLGALILTGTISAKQGKKLVDAARQAAGALQPSEVATMAVAALNGLEKSWTKATN